MEPWLEAFMIGDAYGSGFEMKPPEYVAEFNDGLTYRQHGLDPTHRPGMPTDDTQMTMAVQDVMQDGWASALPISYARAFCKAYAAAPAPGYGRRMRENLEAAIRAEAPGAALMLACQGGLASGVFDTCGAAMRALPCAVSRSSGDNSDVACSAVVQARSTHHHPDSIDAAIAVALAAWVPLRLDVATDFVEWPSPSKWTPGQWERGTTRGKDIVQAALGLLVRHDSLHRLLIESVALGGDVDTLAALCLGIGALAPKRWKNDLPQALRDGLVRP